MFRTLNQPALWAVTLSAAGILMVTMGARQSLGLFLSPLNTSTGLGVVSISLAMAVGQFTWGAIQPLAGAVADRYGPGRVLFGGLLLLAFGSAITPFMSSTAGLVVSLGLFSAIGSGAGSFSVLIGASSQRLPPAARAAASGVINAGGSFGQFVFAPLLQALIQMFGWMGAMWSLAVMTLAATPLVRVVSRPVEKPSAPAGEAGLWQSVRGAVGDGSYQLLNLGFFSCGFHIAFLVTHLPGEVALCGLPSSVASWALAIIGLTNIFGSLYAGACIGRYRSKYVLFWMYASRAAMIAIYLLAPKTDLTFYIFAAGLGFTWLATVPPTAAIVGKLFGVRYLGTLFGMTLLSHQVGGFFGAYLGGLALTQFGDYSWMWYADIALAAVAALLNLPIREAALPQPGTAS
ncbi:MAG: Oxalate:formate exchange protein [Candidatus Accumulibacter regalis]|jgi:MFS family permease|uniref:Oxalate:formate exchange protein n=1 Tax=Accumulibacter regalis TaxID=522306 RepID=A0A011QFA6_ACCRE|nr:MFS transporter [Accumulibacter sp.]EXI88002.1 MAG: Oxalate:formate exchange protein [Candidatus Accumulibacter regalis]MBL8366737.1 MFS transporter [Accumulibacter sp.]MQM34878.1 MFS transporter [Candidatus Accumulibacter phosphatis]HRE69789.1 MFS transporter [Accumulibacter sp.]